MNSDHTAQLRGTPFPSETIDDLLFDVAPEEHPIEVTFFDDVKSSKAYRRRLSLNQIAAMFESLSDGSKSELPLIKLGTFGDQITGRGSLRSDRNLLAISGVEGDHDLGTMSVAEAKRLLEKAGVAAFVHTTPTHTKEKPRWRVLAPLQEEVVPAEREALAAKLNGILQGALAEESFTPSQSFFFGKVHGSVDPEAVITIGNFLDATSAREAPLGRNGQPYLQIEELNANPVEPPAPFENAMQIGEALEAIPAQATEGEGGYKLWIKIGMALHAYFSGSETGLGHWDRWSRAGATYDREVLLAKWNSFSTERQGGIEIATLFKIAKDHGWKRREAPVRQPLSILSPSECAIACSRGYVIKRFLAPGNVGCIFGSPGAGKSVIAPHLAYAVAQGRDVFGLKVKKGGALYVPAEDFQGMMGRVEALRREYGEAPDFGLVKNISDLLNEGSSQLGALKEAVRQRMPSLVVIDTLAAANPGLQENDAAEMGRVVSNAQAIAKLGPAVLLIHHDVKNGGSTPRGHSVLNGALDVSMQLESDSTGTVRGRLRKNRNGSLDLDIAFRIKSEILDFDEDEDPVTAPLALELKSGERFDGQVTGSAQIVLNYFKDLNLLSEAVDRTKLLAIAANDQRISSSEKPDARRKSAFRGLSKLLELGLVRTLENGMLAPTILNDGFEKWPLH